jgi:putative membrane protein
MPTEATPDRHTEVAANRTVEAAERTKETAVRTTVAAQRTEASADRRTELAANRTVLAAERTYAAWVRTGLMSLAAGVGAKKTLGGVLPEWVVVLTGSVLVAFAAFCFAAAVWRGLYPAHRPRPDVRRLPRALLFASNGFLALVALAALLGVLVWPHRRELTTPSAPRDGFRCGSHE